jgi:hypothetical protein
MTTSGLFAAVTGSLLILCLFLMEGPTNHAATREANPLLMCTTVPPAKSRIPNVFSIPDGCQIM